MREPGRSRERLARILGAAFAEGLLSEQTLSRPLAIGRSPSCDIALHEPTVSRRHALLHHRDGTWIVQDLDSKNGLTVNGVAVGRCTVGPGDLLGLGCALVELD